MTWSVYKNKTFDPCFQEFSNQPINHAQECLLGSSKFSVGSFAFMNMEFVGLCGLRHQFGNPEVVGSIPAGGEKLAVGRTFSGRIYKEVSTSGHAFHPAEVIQLGTWH